MKSLLIGLTGHMGCGKSVVAEHLHSTLGFHPPLAFADPLKDMLCAMLQENRASLEKLKRSNEPFVGDVTVRRALQTLGTEWGRQLHPDLWVLLMERSLRKIAQWQDVPGIVIADVRFENEAHFIREHGGVVVHIFRPDTPVDSNAPHISERGVDFHPADFTLDNTGSLPELYRRTEELVALIRGYRNPGLLARAS